MQPSGPQPEDSMVGRTIAHYKILQRLGAGAMGVVYKAEDLRLKRIVALKFLSNAGLESGDAKARFLREARAAASLDHANICTIYEIVEAEGLTGLAMTYLDGSSLHERIRTGGITLDGALEIATQVAQGLAEAHRKGVVHRDIKPANLFITGSGQVKIVDFGLAQLNEETRLTRSGIALGTPAYMAPEQWTGSDVDHHADIWSLGVVLYEMVTGALPFSARNQIAMAHSIRSEDPAPLHTVRQGLPDELEHVIAKALAKRPEERYSSASELAADLQILKARVSSSASAPTLAQLSATAPAASRPATTAVPPPPPRRRRILLPALAVGLLAALAGLIFSFRQNLRGLLPVPIETAHPSIAVLPFENVNRDPEIDYYSDGITEDLINTLTKLERLRVVARTSAFQFKGKTQDLRQISKQLRVGALLTGTVRRAPDSLRITAQLINPEDGYQLWSEIFDRKTTEVFAIQEEIARAVSRKLKVEPGADQPAVSVTRYTQNPEAYNLYLQGRFFWNKRTEEGFRKAIDFFEKAIAADPRYAPAYAGLADAYSLFGLYGWGAPGQTMPKAKSAAARALEIDPSLAEAHSSLALIKTVHDWDRQGAEEDFRRALKLNPGYATAHHFYAHYLLWTGRFPEAMQEMSRAIELDPLSLIMETNRGWFLVLQRKYDEAIRQFQATLGLDPSFLRARYFLSAAYMHKSQFPQAVEAALKARTSRAGATAELAQVGLTYALWGKRQEAAQVLLELQEIAQNRYVSPVELAMIHGALGEMDQAYRYLDEAYQERASFLVFLKVDPRFDSLRKDPRYNALLRRMGWN